MSSGAYTSAGCHGGRCSSLLGDRGGAVDHEQGGRAESHRRAPAIVRRRPASRAAPRAARRPLHPSTSTPTGVFTRKANGKNHANPSIEERPAMQAGVRSVASSVIRNPSANASGSNPAPAMVSTSQASIPVALAKAKLRRTQKLLGDRPATPGPRGVKVVSHPEHRDEHGRMQGARSASKPQAAAADAVQPEAAPRGHGHGELRPGRDPHHREQYASSGTMRMPGKSCSRRAARAAAQLTATVPKVARRVAFQNA